MRPKTFPGGRKRLKLISAITGAGVVVTMGAVTLAGPTTAAGSVSEGWKADTVVTLIPATRTQLSSTPQYIIDACNWATSHMQLHGNC
ncbi:hypothetical protein KL953_04790 [Mycolicibacterium goodii]|uniref:hypothetical protein n=1 Tax=Mycolicibacterium goodii TaxID=134601 RepID=UPI001BDBE499|nr:hypothetical protein [Mycolicibacterium goodii]MBU8808203.1 hypothetical protein [Mycolicibacterium goodii]